VGKWEDTIALQKYTPVLRARGVLTVYIFFFNINRVRGLIVYITLYLGTYMRIFFEHLIGF
jgi:hypothetical protein